MNKSCVYKSVHQRCKSVLCCPQQQFDLHAFLNFSFIVRRFFSSSSLLLTPLLQVQLAKDSYTTFAAVLFQPTPAESSQTCTVCHRKLNLSSGFTGGALSMKICVPAQLFHFLILIIMPSTYFLLLRMLQNWKFFFSYLFTLL